MSNVVKVTGDIIAGPQNLDKLPDGTARFAVVNGGGLNAVSAVDPNKKALIDFTQTGHTGKSLANIADDPTSTRYAVADIDANRRALIDFSSAHVNKTLDNVPDGSTRFGAAEAGADKTSSHTAADTANVNGVAAASISPIGALMPAEAGADKTAGKSLTVLTDRTLANIADDPTSTRYAVSNIDGNRRALIDFTQTGHISKSLASIPDDPTSARYAVSATDANRRALIDFSRAHVNKTLDYVGDGATYGRTSNLDLYSSGGVNRVGLRVPGSGQQLGDQRNLLPVTWAGVRSVLSTSPISFSITSGSPNSTINVSVSAVTVNAGGVNVSYNASSGSVSQANGTTVTYYCYYRDATASGGSESLYITTSVQALAAYPDIVMLGSFTATVASGGGGTGGSGSGGGGYCVADDMFIAPGRLAGDAEVGHLFDCIDLPTQAGKHVRALQGVTRGIEECVRMITSDGCALVCSISTPFDLPDGRSTTALHMLGEQVITDLGTATVTSLALVGPRPVTRAHMGGVSYAAGADPKRRIYSHNAGTQKP